MSIERVETSQRMSRCVIYNNTAYFCGQVAKDTSTDIADQTRTTLEKIDELLTSVGSCRNDILSVTIYVKTMDDFKGMNEVWDSWAPKGHAPARACVEASMARDEILVEMSVIAAVGMK